jgi:hypothetical protein
MKQAIITIACMLAWTASANAQDTFDKVIEEMIPTFGKLNTTLTKIVDKRSFDDAKPALQEVARELVALKERGAKLGEPMGKTKDLLEIKYKAKLEEAARKLSTEMLRIKALTNGDEMVKEISMMLSPLSVKKP